MKEIVKTLLLEGVDEDTIHRIINVLSEDVISQIKKVHGDPVYAENSSTPVNKSAKLIDKAEANDTREFDAASKRIGSDTKLIKNRTQSKSNNALSGVHKNKLTPSRNSSTPKIGLGDL